MMVCQVDSETDVFEYGSFRVGKVHGAECVIFA